MKIYPLKEAKKIIGSICKDAGLGTYDTREKFMAMLDQNQHIAVQGYNTFGKIFYWNTASSLLYGYRESEAINQDMVDLILPPEMRKFARDMISNAFKSGMFPEAAPCDLLRHNGDYVTVFSGHLAFQWNKAPTPEFYRIELALDTKANLTTAN